jgi:hypothetical protein
MSAFQPFIYWESIISPDSIVSDESKEFIKTLSLQLRLLEILNQRLVTETNDLALKLEIDKTSCISQITSVSNSKL